jgi:dephospho-CoA kinase
LKKPKRFVVGLTGGIGTGKSTALKEFDRLGASTISLDQIAHAQAQPGGQAYKAIVKAFGSEVLDGSKRIDRQKLGAIVFRSKSARTRLERLTHPLILKEANEIISRLKGVVIVDVPLLFEGGHQKHYDATLLVTCSKKNQLSRVMRRDKLSPAEAKRRIAAQWSLEKKRSLADFTVENDTTPADLHTQTRAVHAGLALLYGGTPNGNQDD